MDDDTPIMCKEGWLSLAREESPDSMEVRCQITSGQGDLRESVTENIPPAGKGEMVR